ncbi:endonuclease domain-containing protein [Mycobacterium sp. LTG2003]
MTPLSTPFIGSEALTSAMVNRHQLRTRFTPIYPNVYVPADRVPSLRDRTIGAWLWSQRRGVVVGLAAAAMLGTKWVDPGTSVELIHTNPRAPRGIITRRYTLLDDEIVDRRGMEMTTAPRTAFDVGRQISVTASVSRLDALCRATGCTVADIEALAAKHPGARGVRLLETALTLVDPGAQSPKESWLRLLLIRNGFPRPTTQIPVTVDGAPVAYLDMGWEEWMVAAEYDGDQHRTDRWQYVKDVHRLEMLKELGWIVIRVVAEDRPADIVRRVRAALAQRQMSVRSGRKAS